MSEADRSGALASRVVLDTNVFVSGVFFGGPRARVLEAWRDGTVSGDRDLLEVVTFGGVAILTPRDFVDGVLGSPGD